MTHQPTLAALFGSRGRFSVAASGLALAVMLFLSSSASAGQVQQITNFGNNPSGIGMYVYTPSNVSAQPPVLVGIHACHGKGTDVCSLGGGWVSEADKYGFLLVCPSAVSQDGCWDVHSTADLTHNGGGDAAGIISMVSYVVQNKNANANRVYAAGHSSGGMMTNVLLGSYPDVFKAGAAFAGVAFGCYAVGPVDSLGWNSSCANGNVTQTGAQWGDAVRAAYPAFMGIRPRMQLWHGTADAIVNFHNLGEEIKEWTNVLGVSATPTSTENNAIQTNWIRTRYTDGAGVVQVEAIQETGQPHNLVVDQAEAVHFFGLDGTSPVPSAGAGDGGVDAQTGGGDSGMRQGGGDSGPGGTD
ncbi:MAG: PHB depolymerase family esterase, partial [Myxococcota bacterium]|nr:PHB depolymerase family esterase [Myxococcota bacterium]